ncbi:MAG: T9SS type A sorting domain-containing protein [Flavobacteriales bacterium]|nr:T9SS type A sorting domain-containing protein [Flavobacteriales bacterium]
MIKLNSLLFVCILLTSSVYSINYTSQTDGNWTSPSTWTPLGVPVSGDSIVINHHIILDVSFISTSGSLTINTGGSLIQDTLNRFVSIDNTSFLFTNYGIIDVDSIFSRSIMLNDVGGRIIANRCLTNNSFVNNSELEFYHFESRATFLNNDMLAFNQLLVSNGHFVNKGVVNGELVTNKALISNDTLGVVSISDNLYNGVGDIGEWATFINHGLVEIGGSFYNFISVYGLSTGQFIIQDSSVNYGEMRGSFDFCDLTPPSTYPYIDWNFGPIDTTITFCGLTTVAELDKQIVTIYPNPTTGIVNFGSQKQFVEVYSIDGKLLIQDFTNQINIGNYTNGMYFLVIKDKEGNQLFREKVVKQY